MIYFRLVIGAVAGIAAAVASPAVAQRVSDLSTGNGLHAACTSRDNSDQFSCAAFVEGFVYGGTAAWLEIGRLSQLPETNGRAPLALYCVPAGVSIQQLMDVVTRGLEYAPQARHLPSNVLVQLILMRAFPCTSRE